MFRKLKPTAIALTLFVAASPAVAAPSGSDVRCFMLSNIFAQRSDKEEGRRLAQATGFYYLGKMQDMSDAEMRRSIAAQPKQLLAASAMREMQACAAVVQTAGNRFQRLSPPAPAPAPSRK